MTNRGSSGSNTGDNHGRNAPGIAGLPATNQPGMQMFYGGMSDPNVTSGNCPEFDPQAYPQWRREVKFWLGAQAGDSVTQLLSKLIATLPMAVKMEAMTYMAETENAPQSRDMQRVSDLLDTRYGKRTRRNHGFGCRSLRNSKETSMVANHINIFGPKYNRAVAKLRALGIKMNGAMIPHRAIRALRFTEGQLPIALSAFRTSGGSTSVQALQEIPIEIYETHKQITDHTDVYHLAPG